MSNLEVGESLSSSRKKVKEHVNQLQRLQEKDPEFFQFLKDVDKDLLDFKDEEDTEDEAGTDAEGDVEPPHVTAEIEKVQEPPRKVITGAMVDTWCREIREGEKLGAVRHLLRAFRAACHHGDDSGTDSTEKFSIISGHVFNKIMVFVLNEMDGILRGLLRAPTTGGKKETIMDLTTTRAWKNYASLMKLYLGNSLHILTQMTDELMIAFTLKRVKASAVFLAAFPTLLRKYIKVALHTWGTGRGALPSVKDKKKGKSQQERSKSTQQTVDHKAYQKVYDWQFISCLELWTGVICAYNSDADFRPLAYPLTQIIFGVASLVPTARYFPLRLRCIKMLNRIAGATGTFIPLSSLLLDMLEMKELHMPPTGGIGKAVNVLTVKQVGKSTLKTRSFQDACVCSVVEELAEHLAQWSYSVAFYELSFIPLVRLRSFCKTTKVDKFRREMKTLIRQVEANIDFTNSRRIGIEFSPNDPAAASFLQSEMESGSSPLSQFVANLRLRAQQRSDSMEGSSVVVGGEPSEFGSKLSKAGEDDDDDGAAVFNSSWLPEKKSEIKEKKPKAKKKRQREQEPDAASDYDIVEDLVLSSDDEDDDEEEKPSHDSASEEEEHGSKSKSVKHRRNKPNQGRKKQKSGSNSSKNRKGTRPNKKAKKGAGN